MSFFGLFGRRDKDPIDAIPVQLRFKLMNWLKAFEAISGGRQYLENHLELLRDESEQFFTIMMSKAEDDPELVERLRISRELLHTSRAHGSTHAAVRDAFVDEFGAFSALDLPPWLNAMRRQIGQGLKKADALSLLRNAITRAERDAAVAPEITASLQVTLAEILEEEEDEKCSESISLVTSALEVFTYSRFPKQFARAQLLLGKIYLLQGMRERDTEAMQQTIEPFKAALRVFTRETEPEAWGRIQMGLGLAYSSKGALRCAKLHLMKALEAISEKTYPVQYNIIQEELERISMIQAEEEMKLEMLKQAFDSDMAEGVRRSLYAADKDCFDELREAGEGLEIDRDNVEFEEVDDEQG